MKLLFIVPNINNEGGVARVLSIKINYLIEKLGYDVHIITQNKGNFPLFYDFSDKIVYHDITLKRNLFSFLFWYKKQITNCINQIKPDHIIVADNGLKAFFIPFFISKKINLMLEIHSSLYVQEKAKTTKIVSFFTSQFKIILAQKFRHTIFQTTQNQVEWKSKNAQIIPNPLWFTATKKSNLQNKKIIAVGRHTYEKGLDRLLFIWAEVIKVHPDWQLEIYGNTTNGIDLQKTATSLKIDKNCTFFRPSKHIETKYVAASIFALTSRFEAFGMVLIEAMESGLPCIAFDCPCGPRALIENYENGFLIENSNQKEYVLKLIELIENYNLRAKMGTKAAISVKKYNLNTIMKQWDTLFEANKTKSTFA